MSKSKTAFMTTAHDIAFRVIDWQGIEKTVHPGETGAATWQTLAFEGVRIRMIEYTPGYMADHWCTKGHIVHCLSGEFDSELQNGELCTLKAGMSYIVSDELSSHRSATKTGVQLLIVDGDFLKKKD